MSCYYNMTMTNFEEYLTNKCGHNTIARNLDGSSSTGFMSKILMRDRRFFMKVYVDEKTECAIVEVYPGINVAAPYRAMTSQLCMKKNAERKAGILVVDPVHGDIYSHVESFFKEGPLTGETLEEMVDTAMSALVLCQNELECISHGMPCPQMYEETDLDALLSSLLM